MEYQLLLAIHIASIITLLGAGGGSAFYKFIADRSNNIEVIVHTNKTVVLVDWIFTTPAVLLQPISGILLASMLDIPYNTPWLLYSIILYAFSIIVWFYAVYLQIQMKHLAQSAKDKNIALDNQYFVYVKYWIVLGFFSFFSMLGIYLLMI
ncbi:MAG: DUF2269 domain-containing protein, partial [Sulfurovum sp.]|nr:DUF2269 domain-containing protein [Sulfurovum sp.]